MRGVELIDCECMCGVVCSFFCAFICVLKLFCFRVCYVGDVWLMSFCENYVALLGLHLL